MAMSVLLQFLFSPPPSLFVQVASVFGFAAAYVGFSEARGKNAKYSKFWNSDSRPSPAKVSSRTGMLIAYSPAFLVGGLSFALFPSQDFRTLLLESALTFHFFKRIFEVLFIHKYSSNMTVGTAFQISLYYISITATMIYAQHLSEGLPHPQFDLKFIGIALFLVGISGNFYHHLLLSKTRKEGEKEYRIPKGGLFGVVICPHYLFEIIEFFGFSLMSQTIYSFCASLGSAFYLCGRSYATRRWYLSKFEDFPSHVKAVVPYVF